jgi:hypothetical protein
MKPSDWLDLVDSHGIYDADMLGELDERYRDAVPLHTHAETVAAIERRGLGGELEPVTPEHDELFYGYQAASALAALCLDGRIPGDRFSGRGSAFRANYSALKEAGY